MIELKCGWDLFKPGLFEWLVALALAGRVWLMTLEPPCTTFSLARKPGLRDMDQAEGYDAADLLTNAGNVIGIMCVCFAC